MSVRPYHNDIDAVCVYCWHCACSRVRVDARSTGLSSRYTRTRASVLVVMAAPRNRQTLPGGGWWRRDALAINIKVKSNCVCIPSKRCLWMCAAMCVDLL